MISTEHIEESLKASGFPPCTPVSATDNKQLAQQLRGDEYVDGTATKTATGYRLDARLVLARDASAAQPLPPAEAPKLGDAARQVSKSVFAALKQIPGETKCFNSARAGKYPEALVAARAAIARYPPATIARLCIANTLVVDEGAAGLRARGHQGDPGVPIRTTTARSSCRRRRTTTEELRCSGAGLGWS